MIIPIIFGTNKQPVSTECYNYEPLSDLRSGQQNLARLHRSGETRLLFKDSSLGVSHSTAVKDPGTVLICNTAFSASFNV